MVEKTCVPRECQAEQSLEKLALKAVLLRAQSRRSTIGNSSLAKLHSHVQSRAGHEELETKL